MSDSLAPSRIVAKLRGTGSRRGNAAGKPGTAIRFALIAAVIPVLFASNVAVAQVSGMATPTPSIGATSPLGTGTGSTVSPTGIPLGSTELASPGISPAPAFSNVGNDHSRRRRRNDNGKRNTGDRWDHGSAGNVIIVRNIDLVRNIR